MQQSLFKEYSMQDIRRLGEEKSKQNLLLLIDLYKNYDCNIEIKREIVSSIGRQKEDEIIYTFLNDNVFRTGYMELVYQMYRTCLYKSKNTNFLELGKKIYDFFDNEVIKKMKDYYDYRHTNKRNEKKKPQITVPTLLVGDNQKTLKKLDDNSIQLIFTSPPYYNARIYSDYKSYQDYLNSMYKTLKECCRVLEDGRFIIINVSPVITKRPGREFESIRYPIHYDFHAILTKAGFYFIDEIQWIKPESSVKNRNGGYQQTQMPLSYKPNCINESIMVYRKNAPFLLDKNIHKYDKSYANNEKLFDTSNCWYIAPKSDKNHPAVFPEELCKKILTYYSFKGDVVLDPFAGSGTLGRVARQMNRIPVLCEMNEKYCDVIRREEYANL